MSKACILLEDNTIVPTACITLERVWPAGSKRERKKENREREMERARERERSEKICKRKGEGEKKERERWKRDILVLLPHLNLQGAVFRAGCGYCVAILPVHSLGQRHAARLFQYVASLTERT